MSNGSVTYGGGDLDYFNGDLSKVVLKPIEVKLTPSTPCRLCLGKGRVNVVPIEDEASNE
jgi:hypothetical protein